MATWLAKALGSFESATLRARDDKRTAQRALTRSRWVRIGSRVLTTKTAGAVYAAARKAAERGPASSSTAALHWCRSSTTLARTGGMAHRGTSYCQQRASVMVHLPKHRSRINPRRQRGSEGKSTSLALHTEPHMRPHPHPLSGACCKPPHPRATSLLTRDSTCEAPWGRRATLPAPTCKCGRVTAWCHPSGNACSLAYPSTLTSA